MRDKITHQELPAIWKHPDLQGQRVAAFTRLQAKYLAEAITQKSLSLDGFSRTKLFGYRPMVMSTIEAFKDNLYDIH